MGGVIFYLHYITIWSWFPVNFNSVLRSFSHRLPEKTFCINNIFEKTEYPEKLSLGLRNWQHFSEPSLLHTYTIGILKPAESSF